MVKRLIIIGLSVLGAMAVLLLVHRFQQRTAAVVLDSKILSQLTEDDIRLILKNEELVAPPLSINELKSNPESRKEYLERLRGTLALAAEAWREGFSEKPEFEIMREMGAKATLAQIYKAGENDTQPMQLVTKEEIQEFFKDSKNEERFRLEVNTQLTARHAIYVAENKSDGRVAVPKLQDEELDHARERWARAAIVAQKARADSGFMARREVQLQLKLQEARLYALAYLSLRLAEKTEPTADEIKAYVTAHAEYDVNKKRERAEAALRRAKGGEDFIELYREFNELGFNQDKEGLYQDVDETLLFAEVREAVRGLAPREVTDRLVETTYGYHIIKLESRRVTKDKAGNEINHLTLRQIVVRNKFQRPTKNTDVSAPFEAPEAIARDVLREEKRKRLKAELAARNRIRVPSDITI